VYGFACEQQVYKNTAQLSTRPYRLALEGRQQDRRGNEPRGCVLHDPDLRSEPITERNSLICTTLKRQKPRTTGGDKEELRQLNRCQKLSVDSTACENLKFE